MILLGDANATLFPSVEAKVPMAVWGQASILSFLDLHRHLMFLGLENKRMET